MTKEPVDAVITWVDGDDEAHKNKLANYFTRVGITSPSVSASSARFRNSGEIDYCVRSILYFAPWIRTIYIVTDSQIPIIIEQLKGTLYESKVKRIDHRDIFLDFEECLPTFNSLSIESVLWRIKGLANNFIYFNDDCILIRPLAYDDFFCEGKIVVRGRWNTLFIKMLGYYVRKSIHIFDRKIVWDAHCEMQRKTAKLTGIHHKYFQLPHIPFALKKNTFEEYFLEHPELLLKNIQYRLRDSEQFWAISLAQHLEIKKNQVVFDNTLKEVIVNGTYHSEDKIKNKRFALADKKNTIVFLCIQGVEAAPEVIQKLIFSWLDGRIKLQI